ncbi:MAG TPA: prolyl oligopeptidase family serine peptidase [Gemmata sp.]
MFALPRALSALLFAAAGAALATLPANHTRADGPKDNLVENVRPVPPVGNDIPAADREALQKGLAELQQLIKDIGPHELLPDVLVYEKAVRWALEHKEIYDPAPPKDKKAPLPPAAGNVKKALAAGLERAKALKSGKAPWATQTGGVLRGYASKIDGSAQPYWLVIPKDYDFGAKTKHRLDFWWHGRGEVLSEANFMANSPGAGGGIIPAPGALILHPYGRYCNANKFAGEIDTFEALEHAQKHYRIDTDRLVARGFSMGGAACWQFAVHYPTLWCANAPGAGFAETPEFLKVFQKEDVKPTWYDQKLWHMYNATDTALNIFNLPTIAYSGEVDSQKQAADVMAREMKKVGLELTHIIGPKTGHSYEKGAKAEVNKLIDAIVAKGKPAVPAEIKFTTYTLRYNQCAWLTVTGLEKHWEPATVTGTHDGKGHFVLKTQGVTELTLTVPHEITSVTIDGGEVKLVPLPETIRRKEFSAAKPDVWRFRRAEKGWRPAEADATGPGANALSKKPGLQGPIDDAFMSAFLVVRPTGKPTNDRAAAWVEKEMKHAVDHWRKQFRGDAPIKKDTDISDADIKNNNLILWGDPTSNVVLAKLVDKLPIGWTEKGVVIGKETYEVGTHVPVLIYPNPLNPSKYVVLNSGVTFREYDYLNNARQVPKLPDYAVIDITTPPNARYPGKVARAGFFGEKWELLPNDGK